MIISYTNKDVIQNEFEWNYFSESNNFIFKKSHTHSREINILRMEGKYKDISILFSESDSRPMNIQFQFDVKNDFYFSVFDEGFFDKISAFFKKEFPMYNKSKYKGRIIKSNNFEIIKSLVNDEIFSDLVSNEDIYSLYGSSKERLMSINISTTNKNKNANNLNNYYKICCKIIDYLK